MNLSFVGVPRLIADFLKESNHRLLVPEGQGEPSYLKILPVREAITVFSSVSWTGFATCM